MLLKEFEEECARCESILNQEWKLIKKSKSGPSDPSKRHFGKTSRASTGLSLNSQFNRQAKSPSIFASQHSEQRNDSFGGEYSMLNKPVLRSNPFQETAGTGQMNVERLFGSLVAKPTDDLFRTNSETQFYSR